MVGQLGDAFPVPERASVTLTKRLPERDLRVSYTTESHVGTLSSGNLFVGTKTWRS